MDLPGFLYKISYLLHSADCIGDVDDEFEKCVASQCYYKNFIGESQCNQCYNLFVLATIADCEIENGVCKNYSQELNCLTGKS